MTNCKVVNEETWCDLLLKYCFRCVARHLSRNWKLITDDERNIIPYLEKSYDFNPLWNNFKEDKEINCISNGCDKESTKANSCLACSDMLSSTFLKSCVSSIKTALSKQEYEFSSFQLLIFMPLSHLIQEAGSLLMFKKIFGENVVNDPFNVKELLKALLEPLLVECLEVERKVDSEFEISLNLTNLHAEEVVLPALKSLSPGSFESLKKKRFYYKRQKLNENKVTSAQVKAALNKIEDSEVEGIHLTMKGTCEISVHLNHLPVFVGGRYNKYSRNLSQTPWFIDGVRKVENSVEEYLADPVQRAFCADAHNFASSGREDVDVRMLGNGRPFMLELINPKFSSLSESSLKELEKTINDQSPDVAVSCLKVLTKAECKMIKEGEVEKTKSYSAVCCFMSDPDEEQLHKLATLSQLKDIKLNQSTPIRVLHRRSLANRIKVIHSMAAKTLPNNSRLFQLDLITQAGTYIKEFVHGDFGRTSPSLRDYLGTSVDIIDLDVTLVNFKWPP